VHAGVLDGAFHRYALTVVLSNLHRDLWRLQVFAEPLLQIQLQVSSGLARRRDLAQKWNVDGPGVGNLHVAGKLRHLENRDVEHILRADLVGGAPRRCRRSKRLGGAGKTQRTVLFFCPRRGDQAAALFRLLLSERKLAYLTAGAGA
jgi:hypothetical protein